MTTDRFGNEWAPGLPYARGTIVRSTEDDFVKLERARRVIERRVAARGPASIFNFSGLERVLPDLRANDGRFASVAVIAAVLAEYERARHAPPAAAEPTASSAWRTAGTRGWTRP